MATRASVNESTRSSNEQRATSNWQLAIRMDDIIHTLDDPRLQPYRDLRDVDLARGGTHFIVESETLVRRMFECGLSAQSVLITTRKIERLRPMIPPGTDVLVMEDELIQQLLGYPFHSGVMAVGTRPENPPLQTLLDSDRPIVVLPQLTNVENVGVILRLAAGFGCGGVMLGPVCHDPYYRRAIRVSMGAIFILPVRLSDDLLADLNTLRNAGRQVTAAELTDNAIELHDWRPAGRDVVVFGNEVGGVPADVLAVCDRTVKMTMANGVDSLNVATAAAIVLYHASRC